MTVNASDRTLGLINIWQVLRKLHWEVELLKMLPRRLRTDVQPVDALHVQDARIYAAINAASTNLALIDWLYHSIREEPLLLDRAKAMLGATRIKDDKAFLLLMRSANKALNACHQICNANKHFHLKTPQPDFKTLVGQLLLSHSNGVSETEVFMHVTLNGDGVEGRGSIDDMLSNLLEWWEATFAAIQIPDRDRFFPLGSAAQ